jgi:hypothetical protein
MRLPPPRARVPSRVWARTFFTMIKARRTRRAARDVASTCTPLLCQAPCHHSTHTLPTPDHAAGRPGREREKAGDDESDSPRSSCRTSALGQLEQQRPPETTAAPAAPLPPTRTRTTDRTRSRGPGIHGPDSTTRARSGPWIITGMPRHSEGVQLGTSEPHPREDPSTSLRCVGPRSPRRQRSARLAARPAFRHG